MSNLWLTKTFTIYPDDEDTFLIKSWYGLEEYLSVFELKRIQESITNDACFIRLKGRLVEWTF